MAKLSYGEEAWRISGGTTLFGLFGAPVQFYSQLADFSVELDAFAFEILGFDLAPPPRLKTLAAPWVIVFFHSETCTGWMSNSLEICWMVLMPLSASSATRALNSGSCLLCFAFILCVFDTV